MGQCAYRSVVTKTSSSNALVDQTALVINSFPLGTTDCGTSSLFFVSSVITTNTLVIIRVYCIIVNPACQLNRGNVLSPSPLALKTLFLNSG